MGEMRWSHPRENGGRRKKSSAHAIKIFHFIDSSEGAMEQVHDWQVGRGGGVPPPRVCGRGGGVCVRLHDADAGVSARSRFERRVCRLEIADRRLQKLWEPPSVPGGSTQRRHTHSR